MGKGDQRSKRGKTWIGTYGKTRPRPAKRAKAARAARSVKQASPRAAKKTPK
jgi:ribosomal small subunit protein bTHX